MNSPISQTVGKEDILKFMRGMRKKSGIVNVNICDVFTKLMNDILLSGEFPDTYKVSTVVPIEKINKTIKCEDEEFRPINMLLIEEKILEHIVKDQLLTFVEENIYCAQNNRALEIHIHVKQR
jgi:hypothetical protein